MQSAYTKNDISTALKKIGIQEGDIIFSHSNIGFLGFPENGRTRDIIFETIYDGIYDVIGESGTLVVPTFTYSFAKNEAFDVDNSPSQCGIFTEMIRLHPKAKRSLDPLFSVAVIGPQADYLISIDTDECFGENSFWDKFYKQNGKFVNINFDSGSTFIHYVEKMLDVPYRYDKLFSGNIISNGSKIFSSVIFFCRDIANPNTIPAFEKFHEKAIATGVSKKVQVGRGAIVGISAKDTFDLIEMEIENDPNFLMKVVDRGYKKKKIDFYRNNEFEINSIENMINTLLPLKRDIISDGYDEALSYISKQIPLTIQEYPTGSKCWTWIIPEKWTCNEAYIEDLNGKRIFSYNDNPLHVMSYSTPFDGVISRRELLEHLYTLPYFEDAVPFKFSYYNKAWGFCCSEKQKNELKDEKYKVKIDTKFEYGTLKVGESIVKGKSNKTFILCAHLCHPCQLNDGLSGVIAGIEIIKKLRQIKKLNYTYKLLILPETIGSLAYLSHHEDQFSEMIGGMFLEMLGLDSPHALQLSYYHNTVLDHEIYKRLKELDPDAYQQEFASIVCNDESQFNAPGVRIPMLSLSRIPKNKTLQQLLYNNIEKCDLFYKAYHSDKDNWDSFSIEPLTESIDYIVEIIMALDKCDLPAGSIIKKRIQHYNNKVPINKYKGDIFLSRYNLFVDYSKEPENFKSFFKIMRSIDGSTDIESLAIISNSSQSYVEKVVDSLIDKGLVIYK